MNINTIPFYLTDFSLYLFQKCFGILHLIIYVAQRFFQKAHLKRRRDNILSFIVISRPQNTKKNRMKCAKLYGQMFPAHHLIKTLLHLQRRHFGKGDDEYFMCRHSVVFNQCLNAICNYICLADTGARQNHGRPLVMANCLILLLIVRHSITRFPF